MFLFHHNCAPSIAGGYFLYYKKSQKSFWKDKKINLKYTFYTQVYFLVFIAF